MENTFELPVLYNDGELLFKAQLMKTGFTYKFAVEVEENNIVFEPDEEMNYRAIVDAEKLNDYKHVKPELLQAIAETLDQLVK